MTNPAPSINLAQAILLVANRLGLTAFSATPITDGEALRLLHFIEERDEVEHFWAAVERGWMLEPRTYFEKEAAASGFKSPIEMAVHYMWKRHAKEWPNASLAASNEVLRLLRLWLVECPAAKRHTLTRRQVEDLVKDR